jgi:hypothetical protein
MDGTERDRIGILAPLLLGATLETDLTAAAGGENRSV